MSLEQQIKQASVPTPSRKWTVYAIHHSHTDIGYTERQEKIEQYHVDFIRQALHIVNEAHKGTKPEWSGFRWTCETFWAVERFLDEASDAEKSSFAEAVLRGDLELSGTYLNMTELPDYDLLKSIHSKAQSYASSIGHKVDSAMTADINGYGWGYANSLLENGIEHLFSCIHTHHGMYALGRKQIPFWWETSDGKRLLVWNGEHYMFGNELGFCPNALGKYMIRDEFNHMLVEPEAIHNQIAYIRLNRYVAQLEREQYPYDFVPVMLSGLGTDNASPNARIIEWITAWNKQHGDQITVKMVSLSEFFTRLKQEDLSKLPVHQGDWPDWWTDGVSSTPMHTQIYRDAQRTLRKVKKLDPQQEAVSQSELDACEQALVMYAEHTWGYHSSIGEPWHKNVQMLEVRKQANAAIASERIYRALDKVLLEQGASTLYPERPYRFRISNTSNAAVKEHVALNLDGWEPGELRNGIEVVREDTGEALVHQLANVQSIITELQLGAGESCMLAIRPVSMEKNPGVMTSNTRLIGADQVYDMDDLYPAITGTNSHTPIRVTQNGLESPFVRLTWSKEQGITSWFNKELNRDMLREDRQYGAFTPIYEVTPPADSKIPAQVWSVRARMGRNRKGMHVERSIGQLVSVRTIDQGSLYTTVELMYELNGISYFALFLKVYVNKNQIDVSVRFHKESVWNPENVYLALPFTSGAQQNAVYADKPGGLVRPWKDQLPGTCLDYSCVQEGVAWQDEHNTLLLSTPDTPLIQWGDLEFGRRLVHTQQPENAKPESFAWLMTNYWETNFKATLGGFYEFMYHVRADKTLPKDQLADALHALHEPFVVTRMRG
ncbi:glycoside hydrolase family 38 C-terminal domain-containing protein [Paenibacillus sp. 1001270B_150601_E10]|uniref:glycoside hydrolase family 38 N-terminal domain-containing protein n=1 Tax=Paenibacillus sp. 1001270B_150601_E10 TaxID=2787079 RepID=UPI00189FFA2B|nr:glycoside hydrolase family 38 C-terminal domain-containing protein [Paenibacillus sp. 1001270B_150601_E10]